MKRIPATVASFAFVINFLLATDAEGGKNAASLALPPRRPGNRNGVVKNTGVTFPALRVVDLYYTYSI